MAFKKKPDSAADVVPANPGVMALKAKRSASLKKIDDQMAQARRVVQTASAELNRARRSLDLLSDNRRTIVEAFDGLIDSEG